MSLWDASAEQAPLSLADGVELVVGANKEPMLFHPVTGRYLRLSAAGAQFVKLLNGSHSLASVRQFLADRYPSRPELTEQLDKFLDDLRQGEYLTLPPRREPLIPWVKRYLRQNPMARLPLTRSIDRVAVAIAGLLRRELGPWAVHATVGLASGAATAAALRLWHSGLSVSHAGVNWWVVGGCFLLHLCTHELAHGVTCRWYNVPVREAGVGLMLYLFPVAYVDRSDAYRLQSKYSRAMISAAGPLHDLTMTAIWGVTSLALAGSTSQATFDALFVIAFMTLLGNLNLLFPSDGCHVVEALAGELNLRRRSIYYLWSAVTNQPAPYRLDKQSRGRRTFYVIYGFLALAALGYWLWALAQSLQVLLGRGGIA